MRGVLPIFIVLTAWLAGSCAMSVEVHVPDKLEPSPAMFVRDVLVTQDGAIWLAGEASSLYRLPVKGSKYHFSWEDMHDRGGDFPMEQTFTCLAQDKAGRVWAGTDSHGVCVFNGKSWKTYDVMNALPGEHVFDVAANPRSGEVAVATSGGVAVYRPQQDTWVVLTRAEGLAEDQVEALAYAPDDSLWLAYSCGGLSRMAPLKPGAAPELAHTCAKWYWNAAQTVRQPSAGEGTGLPSNLNNALCVTPDNAVIAGTCAGIGYKTPKGTWHFKRGKDFIDKNKALATKTSPFPSRPPASAPASNKYLPDDYVSALCLFGDKLAVATRDRGIALLHPKTMAIVHNIPTRERITSLASLGGERLLAGTYGHGLILVETGAHAPEVTLNTAGTPPEAAFPGERQPLTEEERKTRLATLIPKAESEERRSVMFEGDDWSTQGDWPYSKGRDLVVLCAANAPAFDVTYNTYEGMEYEFRSSLGPHRNEGDALRHWVEEANRYDDRNVLISPDFHIRTEAEWDDHGEVYPLALDGPDVWAILKVGQGIHRVSLYFYNPNGRVGPDNWRRDFFIEWRKDEPQDDTWKKIFYTNRESDKDPEKTWRWYMSRPQIVGGKLPHPVLARCRVRNFAGTGVYKTFIVTSPGIYYVRIGRNHSFNTILNGLLLTRLDHDRLTGRGRYDMHMAHFCERYPEYMKDHLIRPLPFLTREDCMRYAGKPLASAEYRSLLFRSLCGNSRTRGEVPAEWLALGVRNESMRACISRFYDNVLDYHQESSVCLRSRDWAPYTPNTAPFTTKELRLMEKLGIDWHLFRNLPDSDASVQQMKKKLQPYLTTKPI